MVLAILSKTKYIYIMLPVTLKLIFRNIWKYKGISTINIFGLSIGMACSILLLLWVNYHLRFDKFQENSDQVYRLIQHIKFEEMATWTITQGPLGPSLKEEVPEIAEYCRLNQSGLRFELDGEMVQEIGTYADPSFFQMFSIRVNQKLTDVPISEPNHIAISESMARKYFKNEDPIGQSLRASADRVFMVTAVFEDYPKQTHWWFDYMIPFEHLGTLGYTIESWRNSGYYTYLKLNEGVSRDQAAGKIKDFLKSKPTLEEFASLDLQPIHQIHFTTGYDFESASTVDRKYLTTFSAIGIFLIIIACINFMNLATARSAGRMREIGMKKTLGGLRRNLIAQFIGEAVVISLISVLIAMMLVELIRPSFNNMTQIRLSIDYSNPLIYICLGGFAICTGILAGLYPAFYLSSFKPISALRGSTDKVKSRKGFRRALVIFQFVISISLITITLTISAQITFMLNKDLGYEQKGVIYLPMSGGFAENYQSIKDDMLSYPAVEAMTQAGSTPLSGMNFSNSRFRWDGQDLSKETLFRALFVDFDYFLTLGIGMAEGRSFSRDFASDSSGVILNEAAIREMGVDDPLNINFRALVGDTGVRRLNVVGISKDYHFRSLHTDIEPQIMIFQPNFCSWALLKIDVKEFQTVKEQLEFHWSKYESDAPLEISFLDESLASLYEEDRALRKIILFFTFIGLLVSILGLIGLTGFTIEQRTKEIGIRKLVGARLRDILMIISSDFLKWILVSVVISLPLTFFLMRKWLENFPYRIRISWWLLLLGGLIAILAAFITIGLQSQKAARANPADSLRYE
jgi:ABC-type antimicrobial peptide transport system permease subunit